jgi:hypothetical protein
MFQLQATSQIWQLTLPAGGTLEQPYEPGSRLGTAVRAAYHRATGRPFSSDTYVRPMDVSVAPRAGRGFFGRLAGEADTLEPPAQNGLDNALLAPGDAVVLCPAGPWATACGSASPYGE